MKLVLKIALALTFALPFAGTSSADPYYIVNLANVKIYQHSFARGNIRCNAVPGDEIQRTWGKNWPRWIYVDNVSHNNREDRWISLGLKSKCHGWIDKTKLRPF